MKLPLVILASLATSVLALPKSSPPLPKPLKFISIDDIVPVDRTQSDVYQSLNGTDGTVKARDLSKRTLGGVYITMDVNWGGDNVYGVYGEFFCVNLIGTKWYKKISSFGPDDGQTCVLLGNSNCGFGTGASNIYYPGNGDLRNQNGDDWNDRIGSFYCYW